ncbi:MAG TPA: DNA repair protein RecO [Acidimicrobiia bacterium]|nr:DNA repair protein RecO [Acidimicrobiia bacterium]
MAIRHDSGIVLRSYSFGEADKIVVLLSPLHGKLRTVAKGVRKTKSRFGGRLESFMEVDVVLYEGRNLDLITQAEMKSSFPSLRRDLEAVAAASTMAEVVDAVAQENEPSIALYALLRRGLAALDAGLTSRDVLTAFLLQLLTVQGLAPALTRCASCGQTRSLDRFSVAAGGILCGDCRPEGSVRLRPGLVDRLADLATLDLAMIEPDDDLGSDAMWVTRRFVEFHLERRIVSLAVLDG